MGAKGLLVLSLAVLAIAMTVTIRSYLGSDLPKRKSLLYWGLAFYVVAGAVILLSGLKWGWMMFLLPVLFIPRRRKR